MKSKLMAVVLAVVLSVSASIVEAANPDAVAIRITCAPGLSVNIVETAYNFGEVDANTYAISTSSLTIQNDSSGALQKFALRLSDTQNWTLSSAPGTETFAVQALFNGNAAPVTGDFAQANDELTNNDITCDGTKFANDETGTSVAASGKQGLWLKFYTPTSTGHTNEQTSYLTITASYQS